MQESTPSRRQRGASSAAWGSMPKSTMLDSTCGQSQTRLVADELALGIARDGMRASGAAVTFEADVPRPSYAQQLDVTPSTTQTHASHASSGEVTNTASMTSHSLHLGRLAARPCRVLTASSM